jgi:hypothetical protein
MGWNFLYNKKDPTKLWTWYLKNKLTMWFLVKYLIMMTLKIRCSVAQDEDRRNEQFIAINGT